MFNGMTEVVLEQQLLMQRNESAACDPAPEENCIWNSSKVVQSPVQSHRIIAGTSFYLSQYMGAA